MKNPLTRLPWFLGAPTFVALVLIGAVITNYLGADYFKRTLLEEANPLAGIVAAAPAQGQAPQAQTTATPAPAGNAAATSAATGASPTPSPGATQTSPATPVAPPPASGPQLLARGDFRDGAPGHRGSGKAVVGRDANGKLVLVLENFSVTNGPDLRVILSADAEGGGSGLDLGKLKATDGTFSYAIPDGTDISQFRSVTIFCAAFPTIFAYATLGA